MSVSIDLVIATKDRPQFLDQALLSARIAIAKCTMANIRLQISDNSLSDQTQELCQLYHSDIQYTRRRPSDALTHFLDIWSSSDRDYLMIMHDDDRIMPDYFKTAFEIHENNPHLAAIGFNCYTVDKDLQLLSGIMSISNNVILDGPTDLLYRYFNQYAYSIVPFPSYIYNRHLTANLRFSDAAGKYSDVLFLCEVAEKGPVYWSSAPLYVYRIHDANDSGVYDYQQRLCLYHALKQRYSPDCDPQFLDGLHEEIIRNSIRPSLYARIISRLKKVLF